MSAKAPITSAYFEQMRAHTDEGGQLSHRNGMDLLAEIERLLKERQAVARAIAKTRTNLAGLSKSDDDIYAAMVRRLDGAAIDRKVEDDDEGADPTGTDLFKPRGNGGVVNAEICFSALRPGRPAISLLPTTGRCAGIFRPVTTMM
jgi:chorismate mutase